MTAACVDLNPVLVTADEDVELLVIQVEVGNKSIRIINGYGPQEDETTTISNAFRVPVTIESIIEKV